MSRHSPHLRGSYAQRSPSHSVMEMLLLPRRRLDVPACLPSMEFPRDSQRRDLSAIASVSRPFPRRVKRKDGRAFFPARHTRPQLAFSLSRCVKEGRRANTFPSDFPYRGFVKMTIESDPYRFLDLGRRPSATNLPGPSRAKLIPLSKCIRRAQRFRNSNPWRLRRAVKHPLFCASAI